MSGRKRSLSPWIVAALATLPAIAAYLGSLRHAFVYDDLTTIVGNQSIRDLGDLRAIFWHDVFRPLLNLTYAIDFRIWGEDSFGFHLTNLALHAIATLLLALLLRRAIEDAGNLSGGHTPNALWAGLLAAMWGAHPLLSEAVGYASGRSEVLCGLLVLASLLALRRAGEGRRAFLALGIVCFLAALAVKEVAAVLPLIWWLWDLLLRPGTDEQRRRRFRRLQLPLMLFVALAGALRLVLLLRVEGTAVRPWGQYLAGQAGVVWRYFGLLLIPKGQSVVHEVGLPTSGGTVIVMACWLAVVALAFRSRNEKPLAALGVAWWLAFLAPSSLIPLAEAMAEHRVYLAAIGPLLVLAELLRASTGRLAKRSVTPALFLAIACLAWGSAARMQVWSDPVTLWRDAASKAPSTWAPHYALGDSLRAEERLGEAIEAYRRAVEILPDEELRAYSNLGICLARENRLEEAEAVFRKALEFDEAFVPSYNNLGQLALVRRNGSLAIRHFRRTIEIDPENIVAHQQLAALYERHVGNRSLALRHCREIVRIQPTNRDALECVKRLER